MFGAGESVALDLYDNQCPKRKHHETGEIIFNAAVSAGTSALFTYASGPSNGNQLNDLYEKAQNGIDFINIHGYSNRASSGAINRYYNAIKRTSLRYLTHELLSQSSGKVFGKVSNLIDRFYY